MNNRTLFYLSLIIIFIGLAGIFLQHHSRDIPPQSQETLESPSPRKTLLVAQATRELHAHEILSPGDYRMTEVEEGSQSMAGIPGLSATSLKGYLIRNTIAEGSTLLPDMLESPLSPTFVKNSLQSNELPYAVKVTSTEGWLLNFLSVGDDVVLYLRAEENKNTTLVKSNEGQVSRFSPDRENSATTLTRFIGPLKVISLSRPTDKNVSAKSHDETVGEVIVRLSLDEMKKIRVVEKYAEILLSPASSEDDFDNTKLSLSEVLPQLIPSLSVRELRGNK